jgi:hypothetical protein
MKDRPFIFEIYRLNIVDEEEFTFNFMGRDIRSDNDVLQVLERVTDSAFDRETVSGRNTFKWSVREFTVYDTDANGDISICGIALGRSALAQSGQTVTPDRIEDALTVFSPPSAEVIHLLFYLPRHLVTIEYNSEVMHSQSWRESLHRMLDRAAASLEFRSDVRLEPIPREEEILKAFRSFQRLTRLRVRLRIPNPELDRRTERLRREMVASAIREYTQDMKNPRGLSTDENGLPFATAAMAQAGYKDGEIVMTGVRDGRKATVRSGNRAARGRLEGLKDYIRGMSANAKTLEARNAIRSILEEVDRIAEPPTPPAMEDQEL